jgi:hypothetical protein
MRASILLLAIPLLAGCIDPSAPAAAPADTLIVDSARPDTEFGKIETGPAVGPDLNATTKVAPRLAEGEWWRIQFSSGFTGERPEVVRVVANATPEGYIVGMPHEGWYKEAIAYHAPAFGDVARDLSYNTHNKKFEPVRFPLVEGATWETIFAEQELIAKVTQADEYTATIEFQPPAQDPQPTDPVTDALGLTGAQGGMKLVYDARQHEIVQMDSFIGNWKVVEHGYDFEGWVTVPRGEHTAIDYGTFWPGGPDQPMTTRTIKVEGGFNRLTMMQLIAPLAPGSYYVRSVTPDEKVFKTESSGDLALRFYEAATPDGDWIQEDYVAGVAATYSMGIAYHQYDIHLPDGQRRADHHHPVIR